MSIEHGQQIPPSARLVKADGEHSDTSLFDEIADMPPERRLAFAVVLQQLDEATQELMCDEKDVLL